MHAALLYSCSDGNCRLCRRPIYKRSLQRQVLHGHLILQILSPSAHAMRWLLVLLHAPFVHVPEPQPVLGKHQQPQCSALFVPVGILLKQAGKWPRQLALMSGSHGLESLLWGSPSWQHILFMTIRTDREQRATASLFDRDVILSLYQAIRVCLQHSAGISLLFTSRTEVVYTNWKLLGGWRAAFDYFAD